MENIDEDAVEEDSVVPHISLTMDQEMFVEFFPILQQGFGVKATVPCTIRNLLCDQLGLSNAYVQDRITTIFVDGKATDSIDEAIVKERSTIALSAAMPGVVGATMRRGSYYAAMRSVITSTDNGTTGISRKGMILVKLFNLLLTDLGPEFLKRGIIIAPSELSDFFLHKPDFNWQGCFKATFNGNSIDPTCLKRGELLADSVTIELSIIFT